VGKAPISFGFLKKQDKKLTNVNLDEDKTDFVLSVEEKKINSTEGKEEKKELVIPLKLRNIWNVPGSNVKKSGDESSLEAQAAREIIQESKRLLGEGESTEEKDVKPIPLLIQNKLPDGYETKDKLDVSLRAEQSTLEDYEDVPIEEYGLAMLRGMGWKLGQPIGNTNKEIVKPIEAVIRPKGLGLGADKTAAERLAKAVVDEESKPLSKGSYVKIETGTNRGLYGKIEGRDEDTARLMIQLAIGGKIVNVTQYSVIPISAKEYKEKAKVLNSEKYDKFKVKGEKDKERTKEKNEKDSVRSQDKHKKKKKKRKHSDSSSEDESDSKVAKKPWVRPDLRVRFIDKNYKRGRYFNTKLRIVDVPSIDACVCKTEDGQILDEIDQKSLETVIPRTDPAYVMIISGKKTGQLGEILQKDKAKCIASVQLLKDRSIVRLSYDDICEYVGDIMAEEDY